jgi:hypothetical protein
MKFGQARKKEERHIVVGDRGMSYEVMNCATGWLAD